MKLIPLLLNIPCISWNSKHKLFLDTILFLEQINRATLCSLFVSVEDEKLVKA